MKNILSKFYLNPCRNVGGVAFTRNGRRDGQDINVSCCSSISNVFSLAVRCERDIVKQSQL